MSVDLNLWFKDFLRKLQDANWGPVFLVHGWDLTPETSNDDLEINREEHGFDEFSTIGRRAIEPGEPALSLLYHALMHPEITSEEISYFPNIEEIDALENYVYQLRYDISEEKEILDNSLTAVIMAYEYRVTSRTPHKCHADMVYSRTGVGRVGAHPPQYSRNRRCFDTTPSESSGGTRVQPARYGVFLCEEIKYSQAVSVQGRKQSKDEKRNFYLPKYKLFDGAKINCKKISVAFSQFHQNDKLARMVSKGGLKVSAEYDLAKPPFIYQSNRDDFVSSEQYQGNYIVWRKPQAMVRIAMQSEKIVTFRVPEETLLWLKNLLSKFNISMFYNNRRYTSLRVGQNPLWAFVDHFINALLAKCRIDKRVFLSPRYAGEFTNIRHILDDGGEIVDLNFSPVDKFKPKLSAGGYQAVMYEDPISEGFIHAMLSIADQQFEVKPAYSLMTAPDFMPLIGNIDIYDYEDMFEFGGPRALCEGRLAVNLRLRYLNSSKNVFSKSEQTVTAIVAKPRSTAFAAMGRKTYDTTHYLSDEGSDIFAPGWDVTYTRDSFFSPPYYHTSGLGSPFLEDVKLCAAANGMWPAASPDAARAFKRTTRTAFPLTDTEIGLAPTSTLAKNLGSVMCGWDGEYGPFIECRESSFVVNYPSIERSDYISNYEDKRFDFAKVRKINRPEGRRRLSDLRRVNLLECDGISIADGKFWLVSYVAVTQGMQSLSFINAPSDLIQGSLLGESFKTFNYSGYFYIFAKYSKNTYAADELIRRIQPVDSFLFVKSELGQEPLVHQYKL